MATTFMGVGANATLPDGATVECGSGCNVTGRGKLIVGRGGSGSNFHADEIVIDHAGSGCNFTADKIVINSAGSGCNFTALNIVGNHHAGTGSVFNGRCSGGSERSRSGNDGVVMVGNGMIGRQVVRNTTNGRTTTITTTTRTPSGNVTVHQTGTRNAPIVGVDMRSTGTNNRHISVVGNGQVITRNDMADRLMQLGPLATATPVTNIFEQFFGGPAPPASSANKRKRKTSPDPTLSLRKRLVAAVREAHEGGIAKTCAVCMDPLISAENDISPDGVTPCGHVFHTECLLEWLGKSKRNGCPECRAPVPPSAN
jgi:hypothetical protein